MQLSGTKQQAILTVLCYDDIGAKILPAIIAPNEFDLFYRQIAAKAVDFINRYGEAPKEHTFDIIEELKEKDEKSVDIYTRIFGSIHESSQSMNREWAIDEAKKFSYHQRVKRGFQEALPLAVSDKDEDLVKAKTIMEKAFKESDVNFDPGLCLSDAVNATKFLDKTDQDKLMFGVKEFDAAGICPIKKQLMIIMAASGVGKTWAVQHIAKTNLRIRKKVLHISLEMGEEEMAERYFMSFFGITKRKAELLTRHIEVDQLGAVVSLSEKIIKDRPAYTDNDIKDFLNEKINWEIASKPPLYVKRFPTGGLTYDGLNVYLDQLEHVNNFIPDAVIIDYPDLMDFDQKDYRHALGKLYQKIRGIGVERNMSMIVPTQSNREGFKSKKQSEGNISEDISKVAIADALIIINQTEAEYDLGLARVVSQKARGEVKHLSVLISQCISMGQFCLNSAKMVDRYWKLIGNNDEE